MLKEIATLLTTAKGAAAATLIAGTTVTGGAVTTMPEVQTAVVERASTVTTTLGSAVAAVAKAANERRAADTSCGKPEVVSQRNEADKRLRDAFHEEHQTLVGLRGGKDTDHQKLGAVVKKARTELRAVLTAAHVDVARETLGRTGQVAKADLAAAAVSVSPAAIPTPVTFSEALVTTSTAPTGACDESSAGKQDVTLNATLQAIVDAAILEMEAIVAKAVTDAGAIAPAERGKPADKEKGKPADKERGKPADAERGKPADAQDDEDEDEDDDEDAPKGKPSQPGKKPSTLPGRAR